MSTVYVNARFLTQPMTGVQRFGSEICKQLKSHNQDIIFISPRNIMQIDLAQELGAVSFGKLTGHFWEQLELPLFLKQNGSPLLLNLANTGPILYNNTIVTIHDLSIYMFPKAYSWKFYLLYKNLIPIITRRSRKVITVSYGVKEKLIAFLKLPIDKISVVYNAASHIEQAASLSSESPIAGDYILSVASFNPIKNIPLLLRAFTEIKDKRVKLVLVGAHQKSFNKQSLDFANLGDRVVFVGYVGKINDLAALYKNARAFVFPSLYESFGIPTIEAMTFGCPVITSRAGSLPEICGDAVLYVNPNNQQDITEKIDTLLESSELRQSLIQKGFVRAKLYSWEKSGNEVVTIIKSME